VNTPPLFKRLPTPFAPPPSFTPYSWWAGPSMCVSIACLLLPFPLEQFLHQKFDFISQTNSLYPPPLVLPPFPLPCFTFSMPPFSLGYIFQLRRVPEDHGDLSDVVCFLGVGSRDPPFSFFCWVFWVGWGGFWLGSLIDPLPWKPLCELVGPLS